MRSTLVSAVLKKFYDAQKKFQPSKFSKCHLNFLFLGPMNLVFDVPREILLSVIDVTYCSILDLHSLFTPVLVAFHWLCTPRREIENKGQKSINPSDIMQTGRKSCLHKQKFTKNKNALSRNFDINSVFQLAQSFSQIPK